MKLEIIVEETEAQLEFETCETSGSPKHSKAVEYRVLFLTI